MSNDKDKDKEPPTYPPPSLEFFVRPHHVALLAILVLAFKDIDARHYYPIFLLQLHRMLLEEVSEVSMELVCCCSEPQIFVVCSP